MFNQYQIRHRQLCQEAIDAIEKYGSPTAASEALGEPRQTLNSRKAAAERMGLKPNQPLAPIPEPPRDIYGDIPKYLRKRPRTSTKELAQHFKADPREIEETIRSLKDQGVSIHKFADGWEITPPPIGHRGTISHEIKSDANGWFHFGVVADNHLGSKYERLDVLNSIYDTFAAEGITTVFNLGNYIDGEARFNKHELLVHGMDAQIRYLAKHYPQRKGITTFAVTGDDHEGWYAQREGVDVGRYVQSTMRDLGRNDWVDLGYMNAYVRMIHKKTKAESVMEVCHPGGGSAYADSYAVQKAVEAMEGGEKPAIWLGGHYHKMICVNYRNVWCFLCGCTKDLDTFGRKKKLRYVIGGALCSAKMDGDTGAITRFRPDMLQFFNRGYYDGRWSHHGNVVLPERSGP